MRFSAFPEELQLPAPTLGEHDAEVLRDYLGYSPQQSERLEVDGTLYRGGAIALIDGKPCKK